jgi:hypothetical protein
VSPSTTLAALAQVREMGRALMPLADSPRGLERRQATSESRLDRAAVVVADIQRRLTGVERRLDPQNVVTDEQAAVISGRVKALALLLTSCDPSKNHFGGIFGELYRRYRVSDYKSIRRDQFEDVLQFLDDWQAAVLAGEET